MLELKSNEKTVHTQLNLTNKIQLTNEGIKNCFADKKIAQSLFCGCRNSFVAIVSC